jgi:ferredoxin/flavodoxin---NADP+ reductase
VAVIGSGPAGAYAAGHLLAAGDVEVDLFERLPTPWGLVRSGVAPDHPKIKSVTRVYEKSLADERLRFFGNVELGRDVTREELLERYDAVVYAVGAEADRPLRIPGSDLPGVWPATKFVGWYNGHPDHRDHEFDLSVDRAVVVGMGNVAVDVARMLVLADEELAPTDTADHALEELAASRVDDVTLLGRRGPVEAAFTTPELRELAELQQADVDVLPEQVDGADPSEATPTVQRNVALLQELAHREPTNARKTIRMRFLRSPVEVLGDGRVEAVRVEVNELVDGRARGTGVFEELPCGLVLTSIGYKGRPLPGVPFDEDRGVIPNDGGRVADREYVTGWIRRGPSGIIGTNKKDALEVVKRLLDETTDGGRPSGDEIEQWVRERQPRVVLAHHWQAIDTHERGLGEPHGRPRVKLTRIEELLGAGGC